MVRTSFLTAVLLAGFSGAALAGGGCDWSHGTTAGDYTPAPVADAADSGETPVLLPMGDTKTETDEG